MRIGILLRELDVDAFPFRARGTPSGTSLRPFSNAILRTEGTEKTAPIASAGAISRRRRNNYAAAG